MSIILSIFSKPFIDLYIPAGSLEPLILLFNALYKVSRIKEDFLLMLQEEDVRLVKEMVLQK